MRGDVIMRGLKKRRVFEKGHYRKFLVVLDDTPEFEVALYFAARVANRTGGRLAMLHVNEPVRSSGWFSMRESPPVPHASNTDQIFDRIREKLKEMGLDDLKTEAIVRDGDKAEEILKVINADEDIAILVLGASPGPAGPGPLVSSLATGSRAGMFPIPVYLVPGTLTLDEVAALA